MKINSYRLETENLKNNCFSVQHYKTLGEAEKQGYRHTFLEYFTNNIMMPKDKRLFAVWESSLIIL